MGTVKTQNIGFQTATVIWKRQMQPLFVGVHLQVPTALRSQGLGPHNRGHSRGAVMKISVIGGARRLARLLYVHFAFEIPS